MEKYLTTKDLRTKYRLPRTTVYYFIRTAGFPKPIKIGARKVLWEKDAIDQWFEARKGER